MRKALRLAEGILLVLNARHYHYNIFLNFLPLPSNFITAHRGRSSNRVCGRHAVNALRWAFISDRSDRQLGTKTRNRIASRNGRFS